MSDEQYFMERYSRHFPLQSIGIENQKVLETKKALIAGVGGLGSVSSELLASIGVGFLRLVDFDVIETSNLPRQKLYQDSDIGKAKVDIAEERLKLRNPLIQIDPQATRIDAISSQYLLDEINVVVDGLDLFRTRNILHNAAYARNIPYIFAGAVGESANIMTIIPDSDQPCLECVLGETNDDPNQSCEIRGVHPSILHLAAGVQATEAFKVLVEGKPSLVGKMMFIDLDTLDFETVKFKKRNDCKVCSDIETGDLDGGKIGEMAKAYREITGYGKAMITSICGKDTIVVDPKWEINWNFDVVKEQIADEWNIIVEGNNYVTFKVEQANVSLMKSSVSTVRGSGSSKNAISIIQKVFNSFEF